MSDASNDKLLDEYLTGASEFSTRYRKLDADEVPSELDDLVLTAGRSSAPEVRSHLQRWRRWSVPAALAATVVLTVSIVVNNDAQKLSEPAAEASARTQALDGATSQTKPVFIEPAIENDTPAVKLELPPQYNMDSGGALREAVPSAVADNDNSSKKLSKSTAEEADVATPAAPASASAPATIPPARSELRRAADAVSEKKQHQANPTVWLAHIRELRKLGHTGEANEEWREFVEAYPSYSVDAADVARGIVVR
ncbi:MAG: hypothetical protein H7Y02_05475 [Candidatus Obscuribacterales bacterium]|nr:hypothetical protein [Steroidobacteraceae bacterium]